MYNEIKIMVALALLTTLEPEFDKTLEIFIKNLLSLLFSRSLSWDMFRVVFTPSKFGGINFLVWLFSLCPCTVAVDEEFQS